jgi:beta-glucosidase
MGIDVDGVMAELTLEQKVSLLAGFDAWHTVTLPGVPAMRCSDGPAGVRGTSWQGAASSSFPCGTALAASFDPALVEEVGEALGVEARSKGVNVLLAPTVNLHRTPVGGRNFECMSEDPFLTARIAVGYVRGVQRHGVAACIKHFVANDTEFERMTISSEVDERTLRELYLVPFEAAVQPIDSGGADARALMSSYNRINGTYASENAPLLRGVLRDEWGFDGVVFSDWFGTHSAAESLEAGLDLEMPGPLRHRGAALLAAVEAGAVGADRVDESVRRLLNLFVWSSVGEIDTTERTDDSPATRSVIRRAAIAGTVLLKNDGGLLPLAGSATLALIGPNADRGQIQGGGSARVRANEPSATVAALRARGVDVLHERGCSINKRLPALRGDFTMHYTSGDGTTATAATDRLNMLWMDPPARGIDLRHFGVRVTGSFMPAESGTWQFGLTCVGPAVLRVDGRVIADLAVAQTGGGFFGLGSTEVRGTMDLRAGVECSVEVDQPLTESDQIRGLTVGAEAPLRADAIAKAAGVAATADIAVVVVGTNDDWETEGEDRTSMSLPGAQDELVAAVAAANPNTVVVVNAGSPVAMPWLDSVAAVMQVWFPGEEFGEALADMLLGVVEPGGRLPVSLPRRLEDTPAFAHHPGRGGKAVYAEGLFIGHRWYDATGTAPLFAFGFGLGYTTFELGTPDVSGSVDDGVVVRIEVRNTGLRAGAEVIQCYVAPPAGDLARPLRTLRGFAKVQLEPGRSATVEIRLDRRAFSSWDVDTHGWLVPPGDHVVLVGTSSCDLPEAVTISVAG